MTTENIDIRIREDGSRVVQRNIEGIASSSDAAQRAIDLLKRALGGLAAAFAIDKLIQYTDAWSNFAGQINVATQSVEQAAAVQDLLFQAAQHTRTGLGDMVQLYSRAARAGSELGASQQQVIEFTEGIGKALVIQHVSAEQASGALLQLGQLLGTGKVRAQEFNSVNENLSVVLQTVAKNIKGAGGSVNSLRALMNEGKLSSKEFFDAFLKGNAGLEAEFQKSSQTIAQSFTVIRNETVKLIGGLDKTIGVSAGIAKLANTVATSETQIKQAIADVSKELLVGAAAWATYRAAQAASAASAAISSAVSYAVAVANGSAVTLGSAEAERQRAVALLASAEAETLATAAREAANVAAAQSSLVSAQAELSKVAATQAGLAISREAALAQLAKANADLASARAAQTAASAAGAQSYALAILRTATLDAAAAEQVRSAALAELALLGKQSARVSALQTEALAAQTVAQTALTAATASAAVANGAALASQAAAGAKAAEAAKAASGTTGLFGQAIAGLGLLFSKLWRFAAPFFALIAANPWTAFLVALVAVVGSLTVFGDRIKITSDGLVSLRDYMQGFALVAKDSLAAISVSVLGFSGSLGSLSTAVASSLGSKFQTALSAVSGYFGQFFSDVEGGFPGVVQAVARTVDAIVGLLIGLSLGARRAFNSIPELLVIAFKQVANKLSTAVDDVINAAIDRINQLRSAVGESLIEHVSLPKFDVKPDEYTQVGAEIAKAMADGFSAEGGTLEKKVLEVLDRARLIAVGKLNSASGFRTPDQANLNSPLGKPKQQIDQKEIDHEREALRHLLDTIEPSSGAILDLAKAHKILEAAVKDGIITQSKANEYFEAAQRHYRDIIDPLGKYMRDIAEQTNLLDLSSQARETEAEVQERVQTLTEANIKIGQAEVDALREAIQARNDYNRVVQEQDSILSESVLKRQQFANQLTALVNLLNHPLTTGKDLTSDDAAQALFKNNQDLLASTKIGIQAQVAAERDKFQQIAELRKRDLIDDQVAAQLHVEVAQRAAVAEFEATKAARAKSDTGDAFVNNNAELFQGTQRLVQAQVAAYRDMYDQIKDARRLNLIDEQTQNQLLIQQQQLLTQKTIESMTQAAQSRLQLGSSLDTFADGALVALNRIQDGFTTLSAGASQIMGDFFVGLEDGFANSIGQAAIHAKSLKEGLHDVAQQITAQLISALVRLGIQWLAHTALVDSASVASQATIETASIASAALTATAWATPAALVNVATFGAASLAGDAGLLQSVALAHTLAIPAFMEGGYTGNVGTSAVAGIVHGREFVVNAEGTARNRDLLEAINSGSDVVSRQPIQVSRGPSASSLNVKIENYGTSKQFDVEHLSPNDVRIIARDEAQKATPEVVSKHLRNPNSPVSKALRDTHHVERRR